ncbi:MAG TPA: FxSxx-COOH system tetratricopeptide repeat protein, partial [Ktedonobacteraceae bacterium]|nr:FxSxx-COOH system tetratricopeptide repeat protein [Ktedonobacteraceae bacterium]
MSTNVARPIWNIPYRRNPFFTGCEETLTHLRQALQTEHVAALSQPQGISGLGGIGKTHIALEFAYRYQHDYQALLWVRADSASALTSEYVALAHLLTLPERDEQDQRIVVEAVLRWFRTHASWLLILDNIDDLTKAEPFIPKAARGHILFTTRARAFSSIAQRVEVKKMDPDTGALLLLRRTALLPLQAQLEVAHHDERKLAREISEKLDGLPLALDQAGAYIKETQFTLQAYLDLYQERRQELLRTRGKFNQDHPDSVATTWSLSFDRISRANPMAVELLSFCAFLYPDAIPEEMITNGASFLPSPLQSTVIDPLQFAQSLATLLSFSLISRNADDDVLSMHRLVQAVLKDTMKQAMQHDWATRAIQVVNDAFPYVEFKTWPKCERYLPHAQMCALLIEQENMRFDEAARLLNQAGSYLHQRGQFPAAQPLFERALIINEQEFGFDHPLTVYNLNNLAEVYRKQGQYERTEECYKRILDLLERVHDPEYPLAATIHNNLAMLYHQQGKYEQAEEFYINALDLLEQTLGPRHPNTIATVNNLALTYQAEGKYAEAEMLFSFALISREQILGADHPDTGQSLDNLASIYHQLGKYSEMEPLIKRALAIREHQLGSLHP